MKKDISDYIKDFNSKNSISESKRATTSSKIKVVVAAPKRERVINVQRNKTGISVTVLGDTGTKTLSFSDVNTAKSKFNSPHYEMEQKWYDAIFKDSLINNKQQKKKQTNSEKRRKKKETSSRYSIGTSHSKHKTYEEMLHISFKEGSIQVDNRVFSIISEAMYYVEYESKEREMFRHLQLEYLREKKNQILRQIWIPRFKKILGQGPVSFPDLLEKMGSLRKKTISSENAKKIIDLCSDCVCEKLIDFQSYFYLKGNKGGIEHHIVYHPQEAADCCSDFKAEYLNLLDTPISGESEDIYVGLDFGTSFTKCAYQYDENNKGIFMFGDSPFKSTVVYLSNDDTLSFFRPDKESKQIQFFKATLIDDKRQYSELRYSNLGISDWEIKNNFEMLCSAFFIANIICFMKHKLNKLFNVSAELQIAMGVPLFNNYENQKIYNRSLHAGIYIAEQVGNPSKMSLSALYDLWLKSGETFDNILYSAFPDRISHCTIPELFTEALYLLNRTDYMPGYYFIIDIGGGTADFAFIKKEDSYAEEMNRKSFLYHCPRAEVVNLGNEVRKACENDMEAIREYVDQFGLTYRKTIAQSRFGLDIHNDMIIKQLLFGGGSVDPSRFYQNKTSEFQSGLNAISCKVIKSPQDDVINTFIPSSLKLSPEDKQRLIIATQLADPRTSDAFLHSRPDNYDPRPKIRKKKSDIEDNNPGYDPVG